MPFVLEPLCKFRALSMGHTCVSGAHQIVFSSTSTFLLHTLGLIWYVVLIVLVWAGIHSTRTTIQTQRYWES